MDRQLGFKTQGAALAKLAQARIPLQPHFAYGALDKNTCEQPHAMHLAKHFSAFEAAA